MGCDLLKYDYAGIDRRIVSAVTTEDSSAGFVPDFSGAHAIGDMFSGIIHFPGFGGCNCSGGTGPGTGLIEHVQVVETVDGASDTLQNPEGVLHLFRSTPVNPAAKNAPFTFDLNTPADYMGSVSVGSSYTTITNTTALNLQAVSNSLIASPLALPYVTAGDIVYALWETVDAPTYTVANKIFVNLTITKN